MANRKLSMNKLRQVLRCHANGNGAKSISNLTGIARNTVRKYLRRFMELNRGIEDLLKLEDPDLNEIFGVRAVGSEPVSSRHQELMGLMPDYVRRLKKRGMTRQKLYDDYIGSHPGGYSRSTFSRLMRLYVAQMHPIAHLEHKAGDKMYVDYAGDRLELVDRDSGGIIAVEVLVAILPCSQLTYVEAVMSQRKEDFIRCCENALHFYGGAPAAIVPDNLKAAVKKASRYEAELNEDYAAFAEHHGCAVIPARVRKPRDKALVEGAVKLIYRSIYPLVRQRTHHDLVSLNAAIRTALELHNNARMSGRPYSRREQFEDLERMYLRPLNPIRFELKERHTATVQRNGHVRLDRHYYSVPHRLIGRKVNILYDSRTVEIYCGGDRVAVHPRGWRPYGYTTEPNHLASAHRDLSGWSVEGFLRQGARIHADVEDFLRHVIESKTHPEQAYKSCKGILSFASRVGNDRLVRACRRAASSGLYNYSAVDSILRSRHDCLDDDTLPGQECEESAQMPRHANIRGKEYFR